MVKLNRDYVLKTFLEKVREAKRLGMKEIKIPLNFLDDLAFIICQLMAEELSKAYEAVEFKPKEESKVIKPINRRVLKELKVNKLTEEIVPTPEPVPETTEESFNKIAPVEQKEYNELVAQNKIEDKTLYTIEEKESVKPQPIEEEPEEDDDSNIMYGGTW